MSFVSSTYIGNTESLAASQSYFNAAGRWRLAQLFIVVVVPTIVAVWAAFAGRHDEWIPLLGFCAAFLDATLFNWAISEARYQAAQLSSEYDASLVLKSASRTRLAGCPSPDTIVRRSRAFGRSAAARRSAYEWHYARIAEVEYPVSELLYIRSDLAHDEQMRERYVRILILLLALGVAGLVTALGAYGWKLGSIAASVLFPAVPVFAWLGRETVEQYVALRRKRTLLELVDKTFFNEQIDPNSVEDTLIMEREALHGMQFFLRSTQPSVPRWLHRWLRDEVEEIIRIVLDRQIEDAHEAGRSRVKQSKSSPLSKR